MATAEAGPLTPEVLAALARVDVTTLGADAAVAAAVAWDRVAAMAKAQVATAVATVHAQTVDAPMLSRRARVAADIGAALRLSSRSAAAFVDTSLALVHRLPATLAAVRAGRLGFDKAALLAESVAPLDDEATAEVEAGVLARAADRTYSQHAAALRRAVDRVDPASAAERRRRAEATVALVRFHHGDGMGELFARLPSEELDTVYLAADTAARRAKAGGDRRTLDQLRVAALVQWASAFLGYGDPGAAEPPAGADPDPDPDPDPAPDPDDGAGAGAPPTRHRRPARLRILWSVAGLLGEPDQPGELADSGAVIGAEVIRRIIARHGAHLRRLVVDDETGALLDLTSRSVPLPAADGSGPTIHELGLIVARSQLERLTDRLDERTPPAVRAVLSAPRTAAHLDRNPRAYPVPAALAAFVTTRDRHPTSPCAGQTAASAGDLDHVTPARSGGATVAANLATPSRRWHLLRTHGGWQVRPDGSGWVWTTPLGRRVRTAPYDYRDLLDRSGRRGDQPSTPQRPGPPDDP